MSCCQCQGIERLFDTKLAKRELRMYRWFGPRRSTSHLLSFLRDKCENRTLLDIGGGVGVVQHELFDAGLSKAIQVDGASAYIEVSRKEAERRGNNERVEYHHGDFVDLAAGDEELRADIVSLDRVICCYPDMQKLLGSAASRAHQSVALVFPRDGRLFKLAEKIGNFFVRFFDPDYKMYIHTTGDVTSLMESRGFALTGLKRTIAWQVHLYKRNTPGV